MELERLQQLSIVYWLRGLFSATPSIAVVDEYPDSELVLPTISVEFDDLRANLFELGNLSPRKSILWAIDVFGNTKTQRNSMMITIFDNLKYGVPVYDYNEGFPPPTPTQLGRLVPDIETLTATPVRIFPELVEKLYWRARIRFISEYHLF